MENVCKPVPAFYCCYLLRSTVQPKASLYIGSTPNPGRRLKQHNGITKGGAWRTAGENRNGTKRPWEMCMLVTGFPSKIAALQFEWAWQNTNKSRHISAAARSPSKQRRPPITLPKSLKHLYLLLRASSFTRWPLSLEFLDEAVHERWKVARKTLDPKFPQQLDVVTKLRTPVTENLPPLPPALVGKIPESARALFAIDVGYHPLRDYHQKSTALLGGYHSMHCHVCKNGIHSHEALVLVCPQRLCDCISHLHCLSDYFLSREGGPHALLPKSGPCPLCHTRVAWRTLVSGLTLRTRGEKEMVLLRKGGYSVDAAHSESEDDLECAASEDSDGGSFEDVVEID